MIYSLVPYAAALSEGILFRARTDEVAERLARALGAHQSGVTGSCRRWLLLALGDEERRVSDHTRHVTSFTA